VLQNHKPENLTGVTLIISTDGVASFLCSSIETYLHRL